MKISLVVPTPPPDLTMYSNEALAPTVQVIGLIAAVVFIVALILWSKRTRGIHKGIGQVVFVILILFSMFAYTAPQLVASYWLCFPRECLFI